MRTPQSLGTVRCGHAPFILFILLPIFRALSYIHEWEGRQNIKQAHHTSVQVTVKNSKLRYCAFETLRDLTTRRRNGPQVPIFSCDQVTLQMVFSVCLSHLFDYVPIIVSSWNFQELLPMTNVRSMQKFKVTEVATQLNRFRTVTPVCEFTYDDEMMHIAWCCL